MQNSIKVINLKKSYGSKEAVKNINFEINGDVKSCLTNEISNIYKQSIDDYQSNISIRKSWPNSPFNLSTNIFTSGLILISLVLSFHLLTLSISSHHLKNK